MHVLPKNACWLDMPKMATLVAHQKGWTCQKWQDFIHAIAKKWHGVYAQALDAFFSISNCSGLEWPWKIAHGSYGLAPHLAFMVFPWAGSTFAGWLLGGLGLSGILGLGGLGGLGLHGLAWVGTSPSGGHLLGWNPSMVPCSWCSVEAGKASTSTPMTSCNSGTSLGPEWHHGTHALHGPRA